MVEETESGKGTGTKIIAKKFWLEAQGWLEDNICALQKLNLKSYDTSDKANNIRCPPPTLPEPAKSFWAHGWAGKPADTSPADQTRTEFGISASISQSPKYHGSPVAKQRICSSLEPCSVFDVSNISLTGCCTLRR